MYIACRKSFQSYVDSLYALHECGYVFWCCNKYSKKKTRETSTLNRKRTARHRRGKKKGRDRSSYNVVWNLIRGEAQIPITRLNQTRKPRLGRNLSELEPTNQLTNRPRRETTPRCRLGRFSVAIDNQTEKPTSTLLEAFRWPRKATLTSSLSLFPSSHRPN